MFCSSLSGSMHQALGLVGNPSATLRLGIVHATERRYHAFIARSVTKAGRSSECFRRPLWGSTSVIAVMSAARPLLHPKRKTIRNLARAQKCQEPTLQGKVMHWVRHDAD